MTVALAGNVCFVRGVPTPRVARTVRVRGVPGGYRARDARALSVLIFGVVSTL